MLAIGVSAKSRDRHNSQQGDENDAGEESDSTRDEARRIAATIAKLPELLKG